MIQIQPPHQEEKSSNTTLFLAGSIEMGKAKLWQEDVIKRLSDIKDLTIFNPRRDNWDNSWKQTTQDDGFVNQVEWELFHLDKSNSILFYFDGGTNSPISLFELGMHMFDTDVKIFIYVDPKFSKKGNIDVTLSHYSKSNLIVQSLDEFELKFREFLKTN